MFLHINDSQNTSTLIRFEEIKLIEYGELYKDGEELYNEKYFIRVYLNKPKCSVESNSKMLRFSIPEKNYNSLISQLTNYDRVFKKKCYIDHWEY